MAVEDILINDDIAIKNGDLDVGDSDQQHIEHILRANPGQFYQFPTIGAGTNMLQHGNISEQDMRRIVKKNLEEDNYRVNKIELSGELDERKISIDATRLG